MRAVDFSMLERRVNALSMRERVILLVLMCTVLLGSFDVFFYASSTRDYRMLSLEHDDLGRAVEDLSAKMKPLTDELSADNDRDLREEIDRLTATRHSLEKEIEAASSRLVTSSSMNDVLDALVQEREGLSLLSLQSLPVHAVNLGSEDAPMLLYEHGVRLTVSGRFSAIRDYLREIESKESRLVWDSLIFSRRDADTGQVDLVIKTLGRDREFIRLRRDASDQLPGGSG